jgi:hypothetical protein
MYDTADLPATAKQLQNHRKLDGGHVEAIVRPSRKIRFRASGDVIPTSIFWLCTTAMGLANVCCDLELVRLLRSSYASPFVPAVLHLKAHPQASQGHRFPRYHIITNHLRHWPYDYCPWCLTWIDYCAHFIYAANKIFISVEIIVRTKG